MVPMTTPVNNGIPPKTVEQANNGARSSMGKNATARTASSGYQMQFHGQSMVNVFCNPGSYQLTTNFGGIGSGPSAFAYNNNANRQVRFAALPPDSEIRRLSVIPPRMPHVATPYPGEQPEDATQERSKYFEDSN